MLEIDEIIPIEGISEPYLIGFIKNIKKNYIVKGKFPTYSKKMYKRLDNHKFDFTNSFLFYMVHNRHLLKFPFDVVTLPSYMIYRFDKKIDNSIPGGISKLPCVLNSYPGLVRTWKMPVRATLDFINATEYVHDWYAEIYDGILTVMNSLMLNSYDKAIYFYELTAMESYLIGIVNFMARFGISEKGMTIVDPNGPLPKKFTKNNYIRK